MRIIRRRFQGGNRYNVTVAFARTEELGFGIGDETGLDEMGLVAIDAIRRTDSPQPGLTNDERVLVLDVRTLETVGMLQDIG